MPDRYAYAVRAPRHTDQLDDSTSETERVDEADGREGTVRSSTPQEERKADDEVVGTVDITDFAPLHLRGEVGIGILRGHRGRGYGKEALELFCGYLFGFLRLHQLYAYVPQENEASRRLFCSAGFRETAVLDDWIWREGRYVPVVLLQKIQLR